MNIIERTLNAIVSIRFCLHFFTLKEALKRPIQIHYGLNYKIETGAKIIIDAPLYSYMIKIGVDDTKYIQAKKSIIHLGKNSTLRFKSDAIFSKGISLWLEPDAEMNIGTGFFCNNNCTFRCSTNITLHDRALFGWNIMLNTTDGHVIETENKVKSMSGPITIGSHTWIASNSEISKNVTIAEECIIAQHSLINKSFLIPHCLIAGVPAKVVRENVSRLD